MPCPRSGIHLAHDIGALRAAGVSVVVSLLEPDEERRLGLADESGECRRHDMDYLSFPVPDFGVPADEDGAFALAGSLALRIARGETIVIHCRGGIGRSSMIAAAVMIRGGICLHDALASIAAARGRHVPETGAQKDWIEHFSTLHGASCRI